MVPNYKQMYLKLLRANESAIKVLTQAEEECERMLTAENSAEQEPTDGEKADY